MNEVDFLLSKQLFSNPAKKNNKSITNNNALVNMYCISNVSHKLILKQKQKTNFITVRSLFHNTTCCCITYDLRLSF